MTWQAGGVLLGLAFVVAGALVASNLLREWRVGRAYRPLERVAVSILLMVGGFFVVLLTNLAARS